MLSPWDWIRRGPHRRSGVRTRLHARAQQPFQVIVVGFAAAGAVGTLLLLLPVSSTQTGGASFVEALFTSTSAVCLTGLVVVDTATFWTPFGQAVILGLIQVGGFGILTLASLLGLLVARRLGLRTRITTATETHSVGIGDVRSVVVGIIKFSLVFEGLTALLIAARLAVGYDEPLPRAAWLGLFHGVSAFNNGGFALYSDGLIGFVGDPWMCLPIAMAVITGGLGFPVLLQLRREPLGLRHWSMNTRVVLLGTAVLLLAGTAFVTAMEWSNSRTLGALDTRGRLLAGFFQAVMPRSGGFNSVDVGAMDPATWLGLDVLMFIGGGPASTAGGIKITTFAVLFFIIYTELRGEGAVNVLGKRLPRSTHRQAITVALLSVAFVVVPTLVLLTITEFTLDQVLFEVTSAFATVGLSTGITANLPAAGQLLLVALMFIGRLGPITLGSALALRQQTRLYELPKERPIIG